MVNQFIGAFKSIGMSCCHKISPGVLVDALMGFQVGFYYCHFGAKLENKIYKSVARSGLTLSKVAPLWEFLLVII